MVFDIAHAHSHIASQVAVVAQQLEHQNEDGVFLTLTVCLVLFSLKLGGGVPTRTELGKGFLPEQSWGRGSYQNSGRLRLRLSTFP